MGRCFFTLGNSGGEWGVRGHVIDTDHVTVLDTFALSYSGSIISHELDPRTGQYEREDFVRAHWEFVRRYMEDGPEAVSQQVQFCMPVDGRTETAKGGVQRVFANFGGGSGRFLLVATPLCVWVILGRLFAMMTCKIPQYPADIEAACRVEPNDPYAVAGDSAGDRVPVV